MNLHTPQGHQSGFASFDALQLDEEGKAVYKAILADFGADIAGLSSRLDISQGRLREILARLSELSLIRATLEAPEHYRAVDPNVAAHMLIAHHQERIAAEQRRVAQIQLLAAELTSDVVNGARPHGYPDGVEQLHGIEAIRDRIGTLVKSVTGAVMTFAPGGAQSEASLERAKPQDRELLRRGIRMRTLYLDSCRNSPATMEYAQWLTEFGGEVRTAVSLPIRLMILDHTTAVLATDDKDSAAGALVLRDDGTLAALCALFERCWETAAPLGAKVRGRDESGLTAQETEALRLLGQGLTDEAVAARLGVSPRTARRIAANVMALLGARSRFQAGVRAGARGWLSGDE
ncbi:helix-turn-helix transcriptional regulator [Streptomyces formicae]|uniref:Erythropoiesis-stimulating protein n=1 Tax=Streptomyces formicae TaxID=1616117 RepID=A0A291Q1X6_9ACTN|nr:LuxR family transcriptional regulator [Streptomyces formicae]ATL25495.1 erythropoiesis-stimulating protein [Streptomyces formicae]